MRIVHSLDELLELPREPGVNGYGAREALRLEIPKLAHRRQHTARRTRSTACRIAAAASPPRA